ncbi:MAG TPA: hypothetical protein VFE28_10300 [Candidatus Krumholzibacteria bacterium]|nr:hypothetical protein [Candidatus Krumholzibacteria bacterium]
MRLAIGAAWLLVCTAPPCHGFTVDARRLAMGGVVIPGCQELLALNVAYHSVPARPGVTGVVVPLPLGLVQLTQDMPTFDPQNENFSVTRLANLAMNPPFYLELSRPSDLDGDITLRVSRNEFSILFEDAEALLPQKPFEVGGVWSVPTVGTAVGHTRTYLSPLLYLEGELAFDDAFYAVLARGEPLQPHSTYELDARGETLAGFSVHCAWSAPLRTDVRGNGLYAGAGAKYLLGLGMSHATSQLALSTADTIFGAQNSLRADYNARIRYAEFGQIGNGYGIDLGLGYRAGAVDVGVGVRDLAARVHWGHTLVWESVLDQATGQVQNTIVARNDPFVQSLPTQGTFNIGWMGRSTALAADVTSSRLGTLVHFGAERRAGPLAMRGGVMTDYDARLQWSGGFGIGASGFSFDVALQSHHRTFTGERGLMLATSFGVR